MLDYLKNGLTTLEYIRAMNEMLETVKVPAPWRAPLCTALTFGTDGPVSAFAGSISSLAPLRFRPRVES